MKLVYMKAAWGGLIRPEESDTLKAHAESNRWYEYLLLNRYIYDDQPNRTRYARRIRRLFERM